MMGGATLSVSNLAQKLNYKKDIISKSSQNY